MSGFENNVICTDAQRMQQVLLNFYSNALKFSSRGGHVDIKCMFVKESTYGMLRISVSDRGPGIKPEDKKKLFKMFGFLDTT